jgi:hypothetical protein
MILDRAAILAANDVKTETVTIPEWGGDVLVKVMTGRERDSWEASIVESKGKTVEVNRDNARAKLVARCLVDETGARLFTDSEALLLGNKSASALDRAYEVAVKINRIGAKDLDELTKNSDSAPSADSGS